MNLASQLQADIYERLCREPTLHAREIVPLQQDAGEILHLIEQDLTRLDRPLIVIAVDSARSNRPGVELSWSLIITEAVPLNRLREGFLTALDVAFLCIRALDGSTHHWVDLQHTVSEDGLFQATLSFRTHYL